MWIKETENTKKEITDNMCQTPIYISSLRDLLFYDMNELSFVLFCVFRMLKKNHVFGIWYWEDDSINGRICAIPWNKRKWFLWSAKGQRK